MKFITSLCFALFLLIPLSSWSQPTSHRSDDVSSGLLATVSAEKKVDSSAASLDKDGEAVLTIFNRDIVTLRATVLGIEPIDRVKRAKNRIDKQLSSGGKNQASMTPMPPGMLIQIDGAGAFYIAPEDIDQFQQETLQTTSQNAVDVLNLIIEETHESRSVDFMLRAFGIALLVTLIYVGLVWLVRRVERVIELRIVAFANSKIDQLSQINQTSAQLISRERVLWLFSHVVEAMAWLLILILSYEWLSTLMAQFPITRPWGENLNGFFVSFALMLGTAMLKAIPDLFTVGVIFLLARIATQAMGRFFERVQNKVIKLDWLDAELAGTTKRIANMAIWLFALAMAYPYLPGAQTEAFKGVSVLVGLMISMGAAGLVGQVASGLILTYAGIYRRGEFIRVQDNEGTIVEMGMFTTRIRNGIGIELTLPNSLVLSNVTRNYSKGVKSHESGKTGYIVDVNLSSGYDTPWRDIQAMLREAALRTPGVLNEPAPKVIQTGLADFYAEYKLICHVIPPVPRPRAETIDMLYANIQDVFNEHEVEILSPHYLNGVRHEMKNSSDSA